MGGYQARKSDGPPGWKTLWKGWLSLQTLVEGVHLTTQLRLYNVGTSQCCSRGSLQFL